MPSRSFLKSFALSLTCVTLLAIGASARSPSFPSPRGHVNDFASVVDSKSASALEGYLTELENKTSAEVAVVTVESLDGDDVDDYANRLFEAWHIGKHGKDNGALFLIAVKDRKTRIEVGYGLEPILPDAKTGRLLDENVLPSFRQGNLTEGIVRGTVALAEVIAQSQGVNLVAPEGTQTDQTQIPTVWIIAGIVLFLYLLIRHPWLLFFFLSRGGDGGSSGGFGGGFGGFGGGSSGGGGSSRSW